MAYDDFFNSNDRKNSALVKLKMLIYGVKDNALLFEKYAKFFKEEHYAYDNGNWDVDKNRLTPTELLLPGGIVSKLHIRPDSPLELTGEGKNIWICNEGKILSEVTFLHRPHFWEYKTSCGTPTKQLAQMYGLNCLNFNIFSGCEFHNVGKGCQFCSVKNTVNRKDPVKILKSSDELAEVCSLATEYDELEFIIITGGSYLNSELEFDRHMEVIKKVKDKLPWNGRIKGNVSMMPPKNMKRLIELYNNGVENPSFNMEVWPKHNFEKICPGKEKYVGFEHIINSLLYLEEIYGRGRVWSNFVLGITSIDDLKKGFSFMAEHGIIPGANIYHSEVGAKLGKSLGRIDEKDVLEIYHYAADLYHRYGYRPYFNAGILRNSLANEVFEGLL